MEFSAVNSVDLCERIFLWSFFFLFWRGWISVFSFIFISVIICVRAYRSFFSWWIRTPFWVRSRCLTLGQLSPAALWTAGESQTGNRWLLLPAGWTGDPAVHQLHRSLSIRVEPVLINKSDRLGGPSHQLSSPTPTQHPHSRPSVCCGDSGYRVTHWPPAYQI